MYLDSLLEEKVPVPNDSKHSQPTICSYLFLDGILICYGFSRVFLLLQTFKGFITYACVVVFSGIMLSKFDHVRSFLNVYI
jgi:hypothetical protein